LSFIFHFCHRDALLSKLKLFSRNSNYVPETQIIVPKLFSNPVFVPECFPEILIFFPAEHGQPSKDGKQLEQTACNPRATPEMSASPLSKSVRDKALQKALG